MLKTRHLAVAVATVLAVAAAAVYAQARYTPTPANLAVCDMNGDGQIDINDIDLVIAKRGQNVTPGSLGDPDGNGVINAIDARICVSYCNNYGCAVNP